MAKQKVTKQQNNVHEPSLKIGDICKIVDNSTGHGFEVGQVVIIWRYCIDGYKAVIEGKFPETPDAHPTSEDWWYIGYGDVEKYVE